MDKIEQERRHAVMFKWKQTLDTVNKHVSKEMAGKPAKDIAYYLTELSALNGNVAEVIGGIEKYYQDAKKAGPDEQCIRKYAEATFKGLHYRLNILQSVLNFEREDERNSKHGT